MHRMGSNLRTDRAEGINVFCSCQEFRKHNSNGKIIRIVLEGSWPEHPADADYTPLGPDVDGLEKALDGLADLQN